MREPGSLYFFLVHEVVDTGLGQPWVSSADGRRHGSLNGLQVRRARNMHNFLIVKSGDGLPRVARLVTCCNALDRGCEAWQKHVVRSCRNAGLPDC